MAKAKLGDTVRVHYMGKLDDGVVFDTTLAHEAIEFTIGAKQVIPGFEQAVIGLEPGESLTVQVPAQKAFGSYRSDLITMAHPDDLPSDVEPQVGEQLQIPDREGGAFLVSVTDVSEDAVTLDANHPLAGKDLIFDVRLVEILQPYDKKGVDDSGNR
jgi:peptidylprolyl isomerase